MLARAPDHDIAGRADARIEGHGLPGRSDSMPARLQRLARQIEPPDGGVLVDVAQDIGELQGAAEMMRERARRRCRSSPKTRTDSRPTALATRSQ